jgi:hypothetical protein
MPEVTILYGLVQTEVVSSHVERNQSEKLFTPSTSEHPQKGVNMVQHSLLSDLSDDLQ